MPWLSKGIDLIREERLTQIEKGFTPELDAQKVKGELVDKAIDKLSVAQDKPTYSSIWDWIVGWFKRSKYKDVVTEDRLDLLVKAGALIAAEIDRMQKSKVAEDVNRMKNG